MVRRLARLVALALVLPGALVAEAPLGSAITYQGRLNDGGAPANSTYDFRFQLYDGMNGNAVGAAVTMSPVAVTGGLFTVTLDFGGAAFSGNARWLEIGVRPAGSGGGYTVLSPRQLLTPSPGALFSNDAARLGGQGGAFYLDLMNHTGVLPVGSGGTGSATKSFVDLSTDQTVAGNKTFTGAVNWTGTASGNGAGLTNVNAAALGGLAPSAFQRAYVRTVLVSPVGTAVQNGAALLAALAGITGEGAANRYLLKIEPGVYDVGTTALTMRPYVDIEGSGELTTKIVGAGNASYMTGTIVASAEAELRSLSAECTGGFTYAIAFFANASPRVRHVTFSAADASGATFGIFLLGASPLFEDVTVSATSSVTNGGAYGVSSTGGSFLRMHRSTVSASGTADVVRAVDVVSGSSAELAAVTVSAASLGASSEAVAAAFQGAGVSVTLRDSSFSASSVSPSAFVTCLSLAGPGAVLTNIAAAASGGANTYALSVGADGTTTLRDFHGVASGATTLNFGVLIAGTSKLTMNGGSVTAKGGNNAAALVLLSDATVDGTTATASGATYNRGLHLNAGTLRFHAVNATATGGTEALGAYCEAANTYVEDSILSGTGAATNNYGFYAHLATNPTVLRVDRSSVAGSTATLSLNGPYGARIGGSKLEGGNVALAGGASAACVASWDESYAFFPSTCP